MSTWVSDLTADISASNILIKLLSTVHSWNEDQIYQRLGSPVKDEVLLSSGESPRCSAPRYVVEPANLTDSELLSEDILLIDFGQSFHSKSPPSQPTELSLSYSAPELLFDGMPTTYADIWALACTIYEIRAGTELFASFFGTEDEIIRQIVQTLGKLPEPWWSSWQSRSMYFDEGGEPNKVWPKNVPLAIRYPLQAQIQDIGADDEEPADNDPEGLDLRPKSMLEAPGSRLSTTEIADFEGLLGQMLKYRPEDRMLYDKIRQHVWFSKEYTSDYLS